MKKKAMWLACLFVLVCQAVIVATPLDQYVSEPDSSYSWRLETTSERENGTLYCLHVQSQTWRDTTELNRPVWTHWVLVAVPHDMDTSLSLLSISAGFNTPTPPKDAAELDILSLAARTHSVVSEVYAIPNQHLKFGDECDERYMQQGRKEDALVAYTWHQFFRTNDVTWPVHLPMTKAVVRTMDAVQEFCKGLPSPVHLDGFVLTGKSKRGWTAWTTTAVDSRVKAVIPVVIDLLNLQKSFTRHFMAYGEWSFAVKDYQDLGIDKFLYTEAGETLMRIQEPYAYRHRFTLPKYIINSAGDEFFLPDSSQLYFHDLVGEKALRYIPNVGHSLKDSDVSDSVEAYYQAFLNQEELPQYSWSWQEESRTLRVETLSKPQEVNLWQATNPEKRDFRISSIGKAWKKTALSVNERGVYEVNVPLPETGWTAFFIELVYEREGQFPHTLTTDVFVTPQTFPYAFPLT